MSQRFSVISPQKTGSQRENNRDGGRAIDRSFPGMTKRSSYNHCFSTTIGVSSYFGAIESKFHDKRIWLQALMILSS